MRIERAWEIVGETEREREKGEKGEREGRSEVGWRVRQDKVVWIGKDGGGGERRGGGGAREREMEREK